MSQAPEAGKHVTSQWPTVCHPLPHPAAPQEKLRQQRSELQNTQRDLFQRESELAMWVPLLLFDGVSAGPLLLPLLLVLLLLLPPAAAAAIRCCCCCHPLLLPCVVPALDLHRWARI